MSTHFMVEYQQQTHTVSVDEDNYQALAIVMVEALVHYGDMTHIEAIKIYSNSLKTVKPKLLEIADVICVTTIEECKFTELLIFPPKCTIEYWGDWGQ